MEVLDLAKYSGYALGAYTALVFGADLIGNALSRRVYSDDQLEEVVHKEARKLGIEPRGIIPVYIKRDDKDYNSILASRCNFEYYNSQKDEFVESEEADKKGVIKLGVLELKEGFFGTRFTVRHELYHLLKHLPRKSKSRVYNFLNGFFYEEPTATLYALTGIKLGVKK